MKDKTDYQKTNVDGAKNIVKVCIEKCISKVIFTSSVAVYGFAQLALVVEVNPFNEYGRIEICTEKIFEAWYSADKPNRSLLIIAPLSSLGKAIAGTYTTCSIKLPQGASNDRWRTENKKSMAYIANVVAF